MATDLRIIAAKAATWNPTASTTEQGRGTYPTARPQDPEEYAYIAKRDHETLYLNVKISNYGAPRPLAFHNWNQKTLAEASLDVRTYIIQFIQQTNRSSRPKSRYEATPSTPLSALPPSWKIDILFPRHLSSLLTLISPKSLQNRLQIPNMRYARINQFLRRGDIITLYIFDTHGRERWLNEDTNVWEYVDIPDEEVGIAMDEVFERWRDRVRESIEWQGTRQKVALQRLLRFRLA
ncbi:hypothetical protein TWF281_009052 [Arthrobotrys megalospora]